MKSLNAFTQLEAEVLRADGTPFRGEYQVEHSEGSAEQSAVATCFVECEEGKEFSVKLTRPPCGPDVDAKGRLDIDGSEVKTYAWLNNRKAPEPLVFRFVYETSSNGVIHRPLTFAPIVTTDREGEVSFDKSKLKDLGTMVVTVTPGKYRHVGHGHPLYTFYSTNVLDETKHKIQSAVVGGKGASLTPESDMYRLQQSKNEAVYRFIFKYRSRAWLELHKVIDTPTPPIPVAIPKQGRKRARSTTPLDAPPEEGDYKPLEQMRKQVEYYKRQNEILQKRRKMDEDTVDLTLDDEED